MLKYGGTLTSTLGTLLKRNYNEIHRHYHTWRHINEMLLMAGEVTYAQAIAIIFHDAVYVPGHADNEDASSLLLWTLWNSQRGYFLNATQEDIEVADIIIRDTRDHKPILPESELVLDADLHSLGLDWEVYLKHSALIRKEYCAFDDMRWLLGRHKFLTSYLARKKLFYTERFAHYEEPARNNMTRDLESINETLQSCR